MKTVLLQVTFSIGLLVLITHSVNAQWVQTSTGSGIQTLAISGHNIFAGCYQDNVFLTSNKGANWAEFDSAGMSLANPNKTVNAIVLNSSYLFAGTYISGVLRSNVSIPSWSAVNSGLTNKYIQSLAVKNDTVFAGTAGNGVYRSINNGTSWASLNNGLETKYVLSLILKNADIFAGTDSGVYLSTNNGTTWTAVNNGLTAIGVQDIAVIGNSLFAATSYGGGVFLSIDNGSNWIPVNTGLPLDSNVIVASLSVSGNTIFAGLNGGGVFLSNNSGTSWIEVNEGLSNKIVQSLAVCDSNLFAGTYDGVWRRPLSEMVGVINNTHSNTSQYDFLHIISPTRLNSKVTIAFSLSLSAQVGLKVYNLAGTEVANLGNRHFDKGPHKLSWDTRHLVAGFYTLRMQLGSNTYGKSILISQ